MVMAAGMACWATGQETEVKQAETGVLLEQWGIWLRVQVGIPRYVSPSFALMRDNVGGHAGEEPHISDELALLIDRLVSRLYARYPEAGCALWNWYRYSGMSYRQLGRLMTEANVGSISHVRAQELVRVGEAWIDAALCAQLDEVA
jgi:hypothetical protein